MTYLRRQMEKLLGKRFTSVQEMAKTLDVSTLTHIIGVVVV